MIDRLINHLRFNMAHATGNNLQGINTHVPKAHCIPFGFRVAHHNRHPYPVSQAFSGFLKQRGFTTSRRGAEVYNKNLR